MQAECPLLVAIVIVITVQLITVEANGDRSIKSSSDHTAQIPLSPYDGRPERPNYSPRSHFEHDPSRPWGPYHGDEPKIPKKLPPTQRWIPPFKAPPSAGHSADEPKGPNDVAPQPNIELGQRGPDGDKPKIPKKLPPTQRRIPPFKAPPSAGHSAGEPKGLNATILESPQSLSQTPCQLRRASETASCGDRLGCFISQCNPDGSFTQPQFHGSTGYSWCVDSQGNKIPGSDKGPGQGSNTCATPCQLRRASEMASCGGRLGCFISQCNPDGSFTQPQLYGSTGYSWCVDSQGNNIPGTDKRPWQGSNNCAKTLPVSKQQQYFGQKRT